jgi:hypothetical protein
MSDLPNFSELHAESQKNRIDFLETDLALCNTFARLVRTELQMMGDRDAAQLVLAKAEEGYATIARFLPGVEDAQHRKEIERRLNDLRTTLDIVKAEFHG